MGGGISASDALLVRSTRDEKKVGSTASDLF